jgi:hypothetical protein
MTDVVNHITPGLPPKKFANAQHDFVMFLFHVRLFICLSLNNLTYVALTTNGIQVFFLYVPNSTMNNHLSCVVFIIVPVTKMTGISTRL